METGRERKYTYKTEAKQSLVETVKEIRPIFVGNELEIKRNNPFDSFRNSFYAQSMLGRKLEDKARGQLMESTETLKQTIGHRAIEAQ